MRHLLTISPVIFNEEQHTYTYNGQLLSGITGMIRRQLFPGEYSGVPQNVLRKAAERGSAVHQDIQLYDMGFPPDTPSAELIAYKGIKQQHGLATIANEYTVSDLKHFASNIDLVLEEEDGGVSLADIKTTYTPNIEYVRWQLSVYAYLFELQNPDIPICHLYLIWLRGHNSRFEEVQRIDNNIIEELLKAETDGRQFVNPLIPNENSYPQEIVSAERLLFDFETELNRLKSDKEKLMAGLLEQMQKHNIKSYKGTFVHLIRKEASSRESVDTSLLKKEQPEIYEHYKKTSKVKESLTLKLIDNG